LCQHQKSKMMNPKSLLSRTKTKRKHRWRFPGLHQRVPCNCPYSKHLHKGNKSCKTKGSLAQSWHCCRGCPGTCRLRRQSSSLSSCPCPARIFLWCSSSPRITC
jgi:hypothetical protein